MGQGQRGRRHLVSPREGMASLRDAVRDPANMLFGASAWNEAQLVEMRFPLEGSVVVPPIAFYSISSHTGTRSYLYEDRGSRARPALVPAGATLVHEKGAGARYAWAAPHSALSWLDRFRSWLGSPGSPTARPRMTPPEAVAPEHVRSRTHAPLVPKRTDERRAHARPSSAKQSTRRFPGETDL